MTPNQSTSGTVHTARLVRVRRRRQLAALKHDIAAGIEDLEQGRFQTYTSENIMQLAEDVGRTGREHLAKARNKPTA